MAKCDCEKMCKHYDKIEKGNEKFRIAFQKAYNDPQCKRDLRIAMAKTFDDIMCRYMTKYYCKGS